MTIRLGYFPEFKGGKTVLLEGAPHELLLLSSQLQDFAASSRSELAIHEFAEVSRHHPVELFVARAVSESSRGFRWLCSVANVQAIQGKLGALSASKGHQYFALSDSSVQLVISANEYGEAWWNSHG